MSIQILDIVLWNARGEMRRLPLKAGRMNIITGGSSTGKSALIDIIDYCMAADECRVPGVIRRVVAWYGLRLQIGKHQMFVARKGPDPGGKTSYEVYEERGSQVDIPDFSGLRGTTNLDALEELLTRAVGISPNVNIPPESASRDELQATIRHALKFCFQPQYEIASRSVLYHRQGEPFMAQAIVDTFPYFLGAVREDYMAKQNELRRAKRDLKRAVRNLKEEQMSGSGGMTRGLSLLAEAQEVGLVPYGPEPDTLIGLTQLLQPAARWSPDAPLVPTTSAIGGLQAEVTGLERQRLELTEEIRAVQAFAGQLEGYSDEATEQRVRLEALNLLADPSGHKTCPLCQHDVSDRLPAVEEVRRSLADLSNQLMAYEGDRPALESYIAGKQGDLKTLESTLRDRRREISALRAQEIESLRQYDLSMAQVYVAGRVQLYLDGIAALSGRSEAQDEVDLLRKKIRELEGIVDEQGIDGRVRARLQQASRPMQAWARQLDLEYKTAPLHLDWRKLTLVADTADGELPLSQMGSGKNWVGYHLLAHFALHTFFVAKHRPVPRFLILDQPTQVFYPPDQDAEGSIDGLRDEDRVAVSRMFQWMAERLKEMGSDFQLIITDHADLKDRYFQEATVEKWRGRNKLVPESWLTQ